MGPERPPHLMQYGTQGSASWDFGALDQPALADERDTDSLLRGVNDGDTDSTTAEMDHDSAFGGDGDDYQNTFVNESEDYDTRNSSGYGGANTPVDDTMMSYEQDDHTMYSGAHEAQDIEMDSLHLENAGVTGEEADSPPVHEIHAETEVHGGSHEKRE